MAYFVKCIKSRDNIEEIKQFLIKNNFLDRSQRFIQTDKEILFPVNNSNEFSSSLNEQFPNIEIITKDNSVKHITDLKDALLSKIPKDKLQFLKTAFDTVGTIAIIEIDDELHDFESIIGNTLLNLNKNILTVFKKKGIHTGVFRTQMLAYVAGENTKETIYRENGISLKLNVEEVYFSPRLSTERQRITAQIKDDENILVMFSGCGPYPSNIAKNTGASYVTGIEINPVAHDYSVENMKLNKINNVVLYNGDVKKIIPKLKHGFFGLKSNWDRSYLDKRLIVSPSIIEIFFQPNDLATQMREIRKSLDYLSSKNIKVYLHMPHSYIDKETSFIKKDCIENTFECLLRLNQLANNYAVKGISVHP